MRPLIPFAIACAGLLAGCEPTPVEQEAPADHCADNTPPIIYNLEMNSWKMSSEAECVYSTTQDDLIPPYEGQWWFCIHLDFRDEDANLYGGFFSAESQGWDTDAQYLWERNGLDRDRARLDKADPQIDGSIELYYFPDAAQDYEPYDFHMRVYDECGEPSYYVGPDGGQVDGDKQAPQFILNSEHVAEDAIGGQVPPPDGTGCTNPFPAWADQPGSYGGFFDDCFAEDGR